MTDKGYIKLFRSITDNAIYSDNEPFCRRAAWVDILLNVNHAEAEVVIKNKVITVKPGESLNSLDTWAKRWRWNKSKTRRFLDLLQRTNMVQLKSETVTTRLSVCKWDSYQGLRNANETQVKRKRNASETHLTPNNNDKNNKNEKNEKKPIAHAGEFQEPKRKFSDLQNQVGHICAKLMIEGQVGEMVDAEKKPALLKWLNYRYQKGNQLTTTHELLATVRLFQDNRLSDIETGIEKSFAAGWKTLKIEKQKNGNSKTYDGHLVSQQTLESAMRMVTDGSE